MSKILDDRKYFMPWLEKKKGDLAIQLSSGTPTEGGLKFTAKVADGEVTLTDNFPTRFLLGTELVFKEISPEAPDAKHPWRGQVISINAMRAAWLEHGKQFGWHLAKGPDTGYKMQWKIQKKLYSNEADRLKDKPLDIEVLKSRDHYALHWSGNWQLIQEETVIAYPPRNNKKPLTEPKEAWVNKQGGIITPREGCSR